jgi:hypothetical protein
MAENRSSDAAPTTIGANLHWTLRQVEEALRGLRFGTVILSIQDGRVVQVERTERRRYQKDE